ncbi:hypothetical protein ABL78_6277 [Leptomonas seymouri]|uniref:Uncharacterized protein n=1 Tax=Leptomonas seymouri TaxID=5684 RepID=A0A0N1HVM2_LEPSE|nr:hypothetical protein ABL78_6277 [Leptomonas seymouri]|eukprot:KPI84661.1 hypothetical protein ABL78_6277 [Leptomonas seymouri]
MTIEGAENAYSCRGSKAALNAAPINAGQTPYKGGNAATVDDRVIPHGQFSMSLDTNLESWNNSVEVANVDNYVADNSCNGNESNSSIADAYCNAAGSSNEEDDGCIPYDYESEMEDCSRYTFSAGPYCPTATAVLAATAAPSSVRESCAMRPGTPCGAAVAPLPRTSSPLPQQEFGPHSPQWCERQHRDNEVHHASQHYAWQQSMKHSMTLSRDQMRYALRSIVREACCRELQALRSKPAVSFGQMDAPLPESRTRLSMRASCLLASATSTAQRKARYIQVITEHWKALEQRVEEMLAETEKESVAASESHLLSIGYAINALSLFSNDPAHIIRELNMAHVEEQRRQRHDREAQLLATLETQGRLFVLPTLYAEEVEEPIPVVHADEAVQPAAKSGELTHPWQLLSPNASLYSLTPSSAADSIGELSPSLSCCTAPSETCTPKARATTAEHPPSPLPPWSSRVSPWKDMKLPCLPMLDLFTVAAAVVPSTVISDNETGVPYLMPADPSYEQHNAIRQVGLPSATLAHPLSPQKLPSAHEVFNMRGLVPAATGDVLQLFGLDTAEDSWGSFAEEDTSECTDNMKFSEEYYSLLNFDLRETLTGTSSAAPTRETLTDG